MWPKRRPVRRAAAWDGIAPILVFDPAEDEVSPLTPEIAVEIAAYIAEHRTTDEPFDFAVGVPTPDGVDLVEYTAALADAGVTWWRDGWVPWSGTSYEDWEARVLDGPPRR